MNTQELKTNEERYKRYVLNENRWEQAFKIGKAIGLPILGISLFCMTGYGIYRQTHPTQQDLIEQHESWEEDQIKQAKIDTLSEMQEKLDKTSQEIQDKIDELNPPEPEDYQ